MSTSTPTRDGLNVAVVRGVVSSPPKVRELPSGSTVTNVEITTRIAAGSVSVPVVVHDAEVTITQGDEVVVTGHVARRFFRAGGVTQSRTELIATELHRTSHRKTAAKALTRAARQIAP